jgi:HEAT repeat protein
MYFYWGEKMTKSNENQINSTDDQIQALVSKLDCDQITECQSARMKLVSIGKPAVPALINTLKMEKGQARWEAAKALGQIADSSSLKAFLDSLEDQDFEIRYLASEGLIAIGQPALKPILEGLIKKSGSSWYRNGAHHFLHFIAGKGFFIQLKPVLLALDNSESDFDVALAAEKALENLKLL